MTLRKHADWMSQEDERILELLALDGPLWRSAIRQELADAGRQMAYPETLLEFRCGVLLTHGLIARTDEGRFDITQRGAAFLDGSIDAGAIADGDEESDGRTASEP